MSETRNIISCLNRNNKTVTNSTYLRNGESLQVWVIVCVKYKWKHQEGGGGADGVGWVGGGGGCHKGQVIKAQQGGGGGRVLTYHTYILYYVHGLHKHKKNCNGMWTTELETGAKASPKPTLLAIVWMGAQAIHSAVASTPHHSLLKAQERPNQEDPE